MTEIEKIKQGFIKKFPDLHSVKADIENRSYILHDVEKEVLEYIGKAIIKVLKDTCFGFAEIEHRRDKKIAEIHKVLGPALSEAEGVENGKN